MSENSHGAELDGKGVIKPTPFDAHDKVVRDSGDYEHQEYPKAVAHNESNTEPVVALNAEHEAELTDPREPEGSSLTEGKE